MNSGMKITHFNLPIGNNEDQEKLVIKVDNFTYRITKSKSKGQIVCGPPRETGDHTPAGYNEIYVRNMPPAADTEDILRYFMRAGTVYQLRVLKSFNGINRGTVFVRYYTEEACTRAIAMFNNVDMNNSSLQLKVVKSNNNRELVINRIHCDTPDFRINLFCNTYANFESKDLCFSKKSEKKYVVLKFRNHQDANKALQTMITHLSKLHAGDECGVYWNRPSEKRRHF